MSNMIKKSKKKHEAKTVSFSVVLEQIKSGGTIYREGWNGKGLTVILDNTHPQLEPFFVLITPMVDEEGDNVFRCNTWVPSIADLLAEDWFYETPVVDVDWEKEAK